MASKPAGSSLFPISYNYPCSDSFLVLNCTPVSSSSIIYIPIHLSPLHSFLHVLSYLSQQKSPFLDSSRIFETLEAGQNDGELVFELCLRVQWDEEGVVRVRRRKETVILDSHLLYSTLHQPNQLTLYPPFIFLLFRPALTILLHFLLISHVYVASYLLHPVQSPYRLPSRQVQNHQQSTPLFTPTKASIDIDLRIGTLAIIFNIINYTNDVQSDRPHHRCYHQEILTQATSNTLGDQSGRE